MIINMNDMIDPIDEVKFQKVKQSVEVIYRRGIPFNPKKCWGKNVKLIDMKMLRELVISQLLLRLKFVSNGQQKINLDIIENTTPIDST